MTVRLYKHEAVPNCGSFEVRFPDGKPSRYFYWDDAPGRRMRSELLTGEQALEQAKAFARNARDEDAG
jgi:hypothetical protein